MFKDDKYFYADAGMCLVRGNERGYQLDLGKKPKEEQVVIDDLVIENDIAKWHGGKFSVRGVSFQSYKDLKLFIIKLRYSMDDQVAILLNKDDSDSDKLDYTRMQDWRKYASAVAKKIIEVNEKV